MPGKETIPAHITIDANNPALNNLDLIILSGQIIFDIEEISSEYVESMKSLYPNPAREVAFLELDVSKPSNVRVHIMNYSGQVVLSSSDYLSAGIQKVRLDLHALARGMYTVVLTTQDNVQTVKKLVVN